MEGKVERINNGDESRANKHIILITLDLRTTPTHSPATLSVCVCYSLRMYMPMSTRVYLYIIHQNFQMNNGLSLSYIVHTKGTFTGHTAGVKQGQFEQTVPTQSLQYKHGSVFETPPGKL